MTKICFALVEVIACVLTMCLNLSAASNSAVCNGGTRHVICDSLSDAAENYYTSHTYVQMSEKTSGELLTSLRALMTDTHSYESTYADCRDKAVQTDSMDDDGKISLLYTSVLVTRSDFGGSAGTWNREHVWPKALGGFDNSGAGADLHHIRPSDATINSKRDNMKYGNVQSGATAQGSSLVGGMSGGTYSNPYFEPLDNVKGDVARICLYVYARYGSEISKCGKITNVFQSVDVLLEWCELDPVDEWEMSRNDVVETIQGNRNVFIDYPEYAWLIFDRELPPGMVTPSGMAMRAGETETPPSQGKCSHEFDEWEAVGDGEMMRMCDLCGSIEFAPQDESLLGGGFVDTPTDKPDASLGDYKTIIIAATAVGVAVIVIGLFVFLRKRR